MSTIYEPTFYNPIMLLDLFSHGHVAETLFTYF